MSGNKHEIDGETFIVSDDVDLDELDLEQMVEKGDLSKAVEYVRAYGAIDTALKPEPTSPATVSVEQIWIEVLLKQSSATESVAFAGIVGAISMGDSDLAYCKLRMDRSQALKLAMLSMRTSSVGDTLAVECLSGIHEKSTEELIFDGNNRMKLARFQIFDANVESAFVEVEFYVVPIEVGP